MFFKNATLFRITPALLLAALAKAENSELTTLESSLRDFPLKPIGPLEVATSGFVSPAGNDELTMQVGQHVLVLLGGEQKILPPASINALLSKKIDEFEKQNGRRPGSRLRKAMKEEILHEQLPKALTKPFRIPALLNTDHGYIAVDASSRKLAEAVVCALRNALGSFPALPVNAEVAPRGVMTSWLGGDELPERLILGDEAELRDAADGGAVARFRNQELVAEEVSSHLEAGKQAVRVGLNLSDAMSFTLDETITLRKIKLLDGAIDSLGEYERDDLRAEIAARTLLMGSMLESAFEALQTAFQLSKAE